MIEIERQITNKIVMVRPDCFGFNKETAIDNGFQNRPQSEIEAREGALSEFDKMVETLDGKGVTVVVLESPLGARGEITPDAVFPNNWFSTHPDLLVLYPMKTQNRRRERQPKNLINKLGEIGVTYSKILDLTHDEEMGGFLEGTGSLVLDRENKIAYALNSQRTEEDEFFKWCELMGYKPVFFGCINLNGMPVYHTNVLMSVGENFAVVCMDAVLQGGKRNVLKAVQDTNKTLVDISIQEMQNMCGNILQVTNDNGEKLIVMSERAQSSFTKTNIKKLEKNGEILTVKIDTIEKVGGGSARCTMAEIF